MSEKNDNIKSVTVLTLICLFVSVAIVISYQITKPYIEYSQNEASYKAAETVLQDDKKLVEVDISEDILEKYGCTFLRKNEDSKAFAIQIESTGYKDGLVIMVGITEEKEIIDIYVVQHSETQGIGTRAMTGEYLAQYKRKKDTENIELISGATYTSNGIKQGVEKALQLFDEIKEGSSGE